MFDINDFRNKQNVSIVGNKITISNMNYVSVANPSILKFLKPNTKYTISAKQWSLDSGTTSNTTFRVAVYNSDGSKLHYFTYGGNATKATPSDISGYTHMAIYSTKDGVISIEDLQIEEDSSITEYEPYHEPITTHIYLNEPLRKIGDYADYIDFKNKRVVRNIVKRTLGVGNIYKKLKNVIRFGGSKVPGKLDYHMLSTIFRNYSSFGHDAETVFHHPSSLYAYYISIYWHRLGLTYDGTNVYRTDDIEKTPLTDNQIINIAKEWLKTLSNKDKEVFIILEKPTEKTISLPALKALKGTNVISVDTSVIPSNIKVNYVRL